MSMRVVVASAAALLICATASHGTELPGAPAPLGKGSVGTYARLGADGAPLEIGVELSATALDGLPTHKSETSRCFDIDGSGSIDGATECEGDHQLILPFASAIADRPDIPFRFAMVNYQAHGHPPAAWSVPHFDIHFYSVLPDEVEAIRTGPCDFFIDCNDRERARKPVPAKYVHADFADVGATVAQMGNHLIDTRTPEIATPGTPFTHTWIFGAWDGRIIFHEVMVTTAFLGAPDSGCIDIKQPEARQVAGYYPRSYCFVVDEADGSVRVYLADFALHEAG